MNKLMKIAIVVVSVSLLSLSNAFSQEWIEDFQKLYYDTSIFDAVEYALEEGAFPDDIMFEGLKFEGLNSMNLVMALYCAGVKGQEIRDSAKKYDIPEQLVTAGYKKSVVECGDAVAESQAYTPVATGFSRRNPGGGNSASPSTFD